MVNVRRAAAAGLCVLLAAAGAATLFLPPPAALDKKGERYLCTWDDGSATEEDYLSAYSALDGIAEDGEIELKRGTHVGKIRASEAFSACNAVLSEGSLLELLRLGTGDISRIERAALFREYGGAVYYSVDEFRYTGEKVVRAGADRADRVVLLSGALPAGYLAEMGAREVRIAAEGEFSADRLLGSRVEKFSAAAPYLAENDALYLEITGQKRLIAGLPAATALTLSACDYADEGALLPCTALETLTLPFAGNTARSTGKDFDGTFAWLFSDKEGFAVPKSLKRVKILGGELVSHCFYACPDLEEADACGLRAEDVARDAFADMVGWKTVHSPNRDIILTGEYTSHTAPCGCTVFERI